MSSNLCSQERPPYKSVRPVIGIRAPRKRLWMSCRNGALSTGSAGWRNLRAVCNWSEENRMTARIAFLSVLLLSVLPSVVLGQNARTPDLSGTWKLNPQRSKLLKGATLADESLVIKQERSE